MGYKDIIAIMPGNIGVVTLHGRQYLIDKTTPKTKVTPYEENADKESKQQASESK